MLDIAETLDPLLDARAKRVEDAEMGLGDDADQDEYAADTTLQLIFFDGEEAFIDWTDTDSIYGARSVLLSLFPPILHSRNSPIHADTLPKHGRRPISPHIQYAASCPPQRRPLRSQRSTT